MVIILIYVNIRIYHECEGRIEQLVPRITILASRIYAFYSLFWDVLLEYIAKFVVALL